MSEIIVDTNYDGVSSGYVVEKDNAAAGDRSHVDGEVSACCCEEADFKGMEISIDSFHPAIGFVGLCVGLTWGTVQESAKRIMYGAPNPGENQSAISPFLSDKNAEHLALALGRMHGAALKIGQMLSIQEHDESILPAPVNIFISSRFLAALDTVRQGADVMPRSQLNEVFDAELGTDWQSKLTGFDYEPLAVASIGQVMQLTGYSSLSCHVLLPSSIASSLVLDNMKVAMKIQYPGVADSIESDIKNVELLLRCTNRLSKGLYLDKAIAVNMESDIMLDAHVQAAFVVGLPFSKPADMIYWPTILHKALQTSGQK
ncbi:hypothetical protein ACFE04_018298 [Oxalis oulophora]